MTSDHTSSWDVLIGPTGEGVVAFEDLTARARIREAALKCFGERGYESTTIRGIAEVAGVSPGLLRHHYGSKEDLREACDQYVLERLQALNTQALVDPSSYSKTQQVSKRLGPYISRSLVDGSPTGASIFDEMVTSTEAWLGRADDARPDAPSIDRRLRAAIIAAMAMGVPLLYEHVSRIFGVDVLSPEGERLLALGFLDIYSHKLIDGSVASAFEAGYDSQESSSDSS